MAVAKKVSKKSAKAATVRPPAKELMAKRKRLIFGAAYMHGVLAGFHRDQAKMVAHAVHLGVGQRAVLSKMKLETLREKLAEAILKKPDGATPFTLHI